MNARSAAAVQWKPLITAIVAGGAAGLIAILTYQAMIGLQKLIWGDSGGHDDAGAVRIVLTILVGGVLLLALGRWETPETMDELLRDTDDPRARSRRKILVTALVAIVAVAFGGAIGPEAGLLAVVAECSAIVSSRIARDQAQARAIAQASATGVLGGLYGSPLATVALDDDRVAPNKAMSFVAGLSGLGVFFFMAHNVFGGEGVAAIQLPASVPGTTWLVIVPALVGAGFGLAFRLLHAAGDRLAARMSRPTAVTVVGTALFALLAALVPAARFSGHHQLGDVQHYLGQGDGAQLWLLALTKLVAVVLCLVAGWRGGEVFPLIFIGAAAGAALAVLMTSLDPAAAEAAAMAAALAVGWRRPLAALFILILVVDSSAAMPLLVGVGVALVIDRVLFPAPGPKQNPETTEE